MELSKAIHDQYVSILKEELIPALGCTEPIAIAYAAAKARSVLGVMPDHILVRSSGNIIKNVKGVIVPTTGNLRGIEAAAILGAVGGIGILYGSVVGGLIVGLSESYAAAFLGGTYRDAVAFIILILVLIVRPAGLFGKKNITKV